MMNWLRCIISFTLLCSAVQCSWGACSSAVFFGATLYRFIFVFRVMVPTLKFWGVRVRVYLMMTCNDGCGFCKQCGTQALGTQWFKKILPSCGHAVVSSLVTWLQQRPTTNPDDRQSYIKSFWPLITYFLLADIFAENTPTANRGRLGCSPHGLLVNYSTKVEEHKNATLHLLHIQQV